MERFDISEGDRLAEMVSAAERGETVEITRGGNTVARIVTASDQLVQDLERLHAKLPPVVRAIDWSSAVRQMREDA